jgi:hypothetical protein
MQGHALSRSPCKARVVHTRVAGWNGQDCNSGICEGGNHLINALRRSAVITIVVQDNLPARNRLRRWPPARWPNRGSVPGQSKTMRPWRQSSCSASAALTPLALQIIEMTR